MNRGLSKRDFGHPLSRRRFMIAAGSAGAHDDTAAKFYDDNIIVFTSTAVDPKISLPVEVERNGNIPNVSCTPRAGENTAR